MRSRSSVHFLFRSPVTHSSQGAIYCRVIWSGEFVSRVEGVQRMHEPKATFHGMRACSILLPLKVASSLLNVYVPDSKVMYHFLPDPIVVHSYRWQTLACLYSLFRALHSGQQYSPARPLMRLSLVAGLHYLNENNKLSSIEQEYAIMIFTLQQMTAKKCMLAAN